MMKEQAPLIVQIQQHRDDTAIADKAASMSADHQSLFPILVAIARLAAKADVMETNPAPQAVASD